MDCMSPSSGQYSRGQTAAGFPAKTAPAKASIWYSGIFMSGELASVHGLDVLQPFLQLRAPFLEPELFRQADGRVQALLGVAVRGGRRGGAGGVVHPRVGVLRLPRVELQGLFVVHGKIITDLLF